MRGGEKNKLFSDIKQWQTQNCNPIEQENKQAKPYNHSFSLEALDGPQGKKGAAKQIMTFLLCWGKRDFWKCKPAVIRRQSESEQKAEENFNECIREVFLSFRLFIKRYMNSVRLHKPGKEWPVSLKYWEGINWLPMRTTLPPQHGRLLIWDIQYKPQKDHAPVAGLNQPESDSSSRLSQAKFKTVFKETRLLTNKLTTRIKGNIQSIETGLSVIGRSKYY